MILVKKEVIALEKKGYVEKIDAVFKEIMMLLPEDKKYLVSDLEQLIYEYCLTNPAE